MLRLPLLLAALGAPGAAPFVLQVASWCSLDNNTKIQKIPVASWCSLDNDGSLLATNGSQEVLVALSQMPLVCGDLRGPRAGACQEGGPLGTLGDALAQALHGDSRWGQRLRQRRQLCLELPRRALHGDSRWGQRLRQRRQLCLELPRRVWPPLTAPPQLQIVPERSGPALTLVCHAWGFSPADITLKWLRNGDIIGDVIGDAIGDNVGDTSGQTRALPVGDGTFRAQVTIPVPPGTSGDTLECVALHPSLKEPLSVTWAPGLSPRLSLLVALAVLGLLLGLLLFTFGLGRYLGTGYTPLPGDTHAGYAPLPGDT
ncbi:HLA class II histocompatibility antigen, DM beta chain [Passerculus sandwichensis]